MAKPNYLDWLRKDAWAISDAALLLVGIEPKGDYPPAHLSPTEKVSYEKIMRAAQKDVGNKLHTSWEALYPGLQGSPGNYPFVTVLPGDFLTWARYRRISIPAELFNNGLSLTRRKSTAESRRDLIQALLTHIEQLAIGAGATFNRAQMPGTKDQFKRVVKKHCPELQDLSGATLDDYLSDLGCKFRPGVKQQKSPLWAKIGLE